MAVNAKRYELIRDKKGLWWDIALYVPTVIFLLSIGFKLWFTADKNWTYLLVFMATFFFMVGMNRILNSRLMLLPQSPVAIDVDKQRVKLTLKNGYDIELVKGVRYYPDYAGKSFAVTGYDLTGKKREQVFHKGQFSDDAEYKELREYLRIFA